MKGLLLRVPWIDGLLILGVVMVIVGIGLSFGNRTSTSSSAKKNTGSVLAVKSTPAAVTVAQTKVTVEVGGAVLARGVYSLPAGSRVIDALIRAGGIATASADTKWIAQNINQAQILVDEMKIYVPFKGELVEQVFKTTTASAPKGKVHINSANISELELLSGVGPSMAQRIVDFREKNGKFNQIEDLMKVTGIGQKTFDKLLPYVEL